MYDWQLAKLIQAAFRYYVLKWHMARKKGTDPREVIRLYESGLSLAAVGRILGIEGSVARRHLERQGVARRSCGYRQHALDEHYFDQVDTPEKAYWLGFLAADGHITANERTLQLRLGLCDAEHVRKFAAAVNSSAPVCERTDGSVSVRLHSKHLAMALIALGITPQKTYTCQPWTGPPDLMPHYWRGAVDGDGHVGRGERPCVSYCGTLAMAQAFRSFANEVCGVTAKLLEKGAIWTLNVNGRRQVLALLNALYERDGPVLDRKRAAALTMIINCQEAGRAIEARITRTCSEDGCDLPHLARGMCGCHYRQWRALNRTTPCSIDDCPKMAVARGWCDVHYAHWATHGDPLIVRFPGRKAPVRKKAA